MDPSQFGFDSFSGLLPILIGGGIVFVLMLFALYWLIRRKSSRPVSISRSNLFIDVMSLDQSGPGPDQKRLEFYNMPVQLSALVIAPVGRDRAAPSIEDVWQILDSILPGLRDVVTEHQPVIRVWPAQLSVQGFHQAFFNNVPLPGNHGKGSPWCSLAGKFAVHGHAFVAGLVCRSAESNSAGEVVVQHEAQWMDILRLKG